MGKAYMKAAAVVGASQSMKARLAPAMFFIRDHQQRIIEKHLLGFSLAHVMLFGALLRIANKEIAIDVLDTKRCEAGRDTTRRGRPSIDWIGNAP